jgi:integrase
VARANSRTWRGLLTTTGNGAAAKAATTRSSYPPVASSKISAGASEEAELLRSKIIHESQQAALVVEDRDITLDAYADRWLRQIEGSVDPHTSRSYRENLTRYVRPVLGKMMLRALLPGHIKTLLAKKRQDGLSKNSVRLIRATVSVILGDAVEDGILRVNPASGIGRRGRKRPDTITQTERLQNIRVMSYDQLATFLVFAFARFSRRLFALFLTMADAGVRPGECCGVHWQDFDPMRRTLRVERAVTNSGRIKSTKTGEPRTVDLSPRCASALAALQASLEAEALLDGKEGIGPWVFENVGGHGAKSGQPIRPQRIGRLFDRIVRGAGLPRFSVYDLRHTYTSHRIAQGADPAYVAKQLGHKKTITLFTYYTHFFPKGDRRHVEEMERVRAAAIPLKVPTAHDDAELSVGADVWHHFGTAAERLDIGRAEVLELNGAEGGTRTPTPLRAHDPESCASANSATSARAGTSSYGQLL